MLWTYSQLCFGARTRWGGGIPILAHTPEPAPSPASAGVRFGFRFGAGAAMSIAFPHDDQHDQRSHEAGSHAAGSRGGTVKGDLAWGAVRRVRNEKLFGLGEPRTCLYYIETGVVA